MATLTEDGIVRHDVDGIATLTISAPKARNAITVAMRIELLANLREAVADAAVRAIILTGTDGNFCAGGRVAPGESTKPDAERTRRNIGYLHDIVREIVGCGKPVIAAVEGIAYGAGLSFVTACDYVVAGEGARFCAAFPKVGLAPDAGVVHTLVQRVGMAHARDILLSAREVRTPEAVAMGLANAGVEAGGALAAARDYAAQFAYLAPLSISAIKQMLRDDAHALENVLAAEAEVQPRLVFTRDYDEGRAAFKERRKPIFRGE